MAVTIFKRHKINQSEEAIRVTLDCAARLFPFVIGGRHFVFDGNLSCGVWTCEMPLNAVGWTTEDDEKLVELVKPNTHLYDAQALSRKNILTREITWHSIAQSLNRQIDDCKKRWRGLRDGYVRSKRVGAVHKTKATIAEKLNFLDSMADSSEEIEIANEPMETTIVDSEQVIMDNQEYYEITVVDGPPEQNNIKPFIKILPKIDNEQQSQPKKIIKKTGRKKYVPMPRNIAPIKILPKQILPKPILMNGPNIVGYVEDPQKTPEQRSQVIDKLIEKVLKENTNEIDVFFRSMAASVKKLQPNLIPKVKMEVCNVIAKYEMQSFDRHMQ